MAWKPQAKRSDALAGLKRGSQFDADPLSVDYSKTGLEEHHSWVFRILSIDDAVRFNMRKAKVRYNDGKLNNTPVPDPGEYAFEIVDDEGTPLSECVVSESVMIPVLLLHSTDENGIKHQTEELFEVRYLECSANTYSMIEKLQNDNIGGTAFEVLPDYDMSIKRYIEKNFTKYEINAVRTEFTGEFNARQQPIYQDAARFGLPLWSQAFLIEMYGDDPEVMEWLDPNDTRPSIFGDIDAERAWFEAISPQIENLVEHCRSLVEKRALPENVKQAFAHYKEEAKQATPNSSGPRKTGASAPAGPTRPPIGRAPASPPKATPAPKTEDVDAEVDSAVSSAPTSNGTGTTSRFPAPGTGRPAPGGRPPLAPPRK